MRGKLDSGSTRRWNGAAEHPLAALGPVGAAGVGRPAGTGGMRWMTGVSFSKAPATSAAPTAGRRGSVDAVDRRVAVEVDLAQPAGHRHVAPQASVERGVQLGGLGAEGPARPGGPRGGPAVPGWRAGATSAWVPSTAPTTGRPPVAALDPVAELVGEVGPQVGVVLVGDRIGTPVPCTEKTAMAARGSNPPSPASASTRSRWRSGLTDTYLRCALAARDRRPALRTYDGSDRFRVRPHTSAWPHASRAGRRWSTASTTPSAMRVASYWVQAGSNPGWFEAKRL